MEAGLSKQEILGVAPKTRLLFICSGNRDRSPTAEALFHDSAEYEARSAGTHLSATQKVTQEMLDWADMIFVMSESEDGHVTYLKENFDLHGKKIHDLEILDRYDRGEPDLVNLLRQRLAPFVKV